MDIRNTPGRNCLRLGIWIAAVAVAVVLFCVAPSSAQESGNPDGQPAREARVEGDQPGVSVELNKEYLTGYGRDTKKIVTSPGRWDSSDWIAATAVLGISAGLFTQDEKIQKWVQENKNTTTGHISDDAKKIGTFSGPALVGLGLYGYAAGDPKAKKTFLLSTESFIITGAFVQILKRAAGRYRPYTGHNHDTWSGPSLSGQNEHLSFPSGDASSAFAIASVVASEYDNWIVPPLVYTAATLIALSRVHNNGHWSSDVFVGSSIGFFTGKSVVRYHSGTVDDAVSLAPYFGGSEAGLLVSYHF